MKKILWILMTLILFVQPAVFAQEEPKVTENQTDLAKILDDATLVEGTEKPDIYDVPDLSRDIENTTFEIREPMELLSGAESAEFLACTDTLTLQDDVLRGTAVAVVKTYEALDGIIYLGVCDEDGALRQILTKPFQAEAGTYKCTFDTVCAPMDKNNYSLKLFMWDNKMKPYTKMFTYVVCGESAVYADGIDVTPDVPTYVVDDHILADVNVFSGIGAQLDYDGQNEVIWIRKNNIEIGMYLDDNRIYVFCGSGNYAVDAAYNTFVSNEGSLYVPVTDICEVFGFEAVYEAETNAVKLFSNEVLFPSYSMNFDVESESGSNYVGIPSNDYYSAHINNGLTYFTALGSRYIYVTNGSQTIKYDVGKRPKYILSEGDYIYFAVSDSSWQFKRINKNTNEITTLFSQWYVNGGFVYYNGEIYLEDAGIIYSIAKNSIVMKYESDAYNNSRLFILDRNTICYVHTDEGYYTDITSDVIDRRTNTVISTGSYSYYNKALIEHRKLYGRYVGNTLYLEMMDWPHDTYTKFLKIPLDGHRIVSVAETTYAEWSAGEIYTQSNFSTTRTTTAYRFWKNGNVITATDRRTGENISLMDLGKPCNKLLFADDNCFIHVVYGIGYLEQDGNTYCRYTGSSVLYMNYYNGESVRLYSTVGY